MKNCLIRGIHHICIKVEDIQASVDFYTHQIGYQIRFQTDQCAMLDGQDGTRLEFFPKDNENGYAHIAYACDDVDRMYQRAIESGCEAVKPPVNVILPSFTARIAFFMDPLGNKIELFCEYSGEN